MADETQLIGALLHGLDDGDRGRVVSLLQDRYQHPEEHADRQPPRRSGDPGAVADGTNADGLGSVER